MKKFKCQRNFFTLNLRACEPTSQISNLFIVFLLKIFMKEEEKINSVKFREGNISLVLDSYDDIFSDFDPREYSIRAMSDDFILECKKAALVKQNKIELRLLIPKIKRNRADEIKIKKRLKEYFNKHSKTEETEIKKIRGEGIFWFVAGTILMAFSPFLLKYEGFLFKILMVMIEPAGWFFFWEGLVKFFISAKEKIPDFEFYKKMAISEIDFFDY